MTGRTVLCTYHAHFCSQLGSSFCISVQERYFFFDGFACLLLNTHIFKVLLLEVEQLFLCELHTPPPLFPRVQSRAPSPHMVLALQAGLVSQELLGALTAVDNDLCSACLFAEYLDTHSDRDAWLRQHLSSQFHSLAVLLHQWCCEQSASWARGAVHIPVFLVLLLRASLQRLPRSQLQEGMGVKGFTLPLPRAVDTDRANLLLNLLLDHCYLKLQVSKKNTNRYWKLR